MESKRFANRMIRDKETCDTIMQWWKELKSNRGGRARLRRCREPMQVCLHSLFYELNNALPQWPERQSMSLAAIAGLIANVNENVEWIDFPQQLGTPKAAESKPPMSENRFRQLIKSRDWPEFYIRVSRAVIMLKRNVNILSLAEYIWLFGENQTEYHIEPGKRFQFRMAENYFKSVLQNAKLSQ